MDVIFDIDGTLADSSHRVPLAKAKQWDQYYAPHLILKDGVIGPTMEIFDNLFRHGNRIFLLTGRRQSCEKATRQWFAQFDYDIDGHRIHLMMRPNNNRQPSHIVKEEMLGGLLVQGYKPQIAFDDRPSDARMFRNNGLVCFLNQEKEF